MMRVPRNLPDVKHAKPGRTALYRPRDRRGGLLYVGITNSPEHRFAQHAADKDWWPEVDRIEITWHPTRRAALEAEWMAIKTEHPIHNKQHNDHYRGRTYRAPRAARTPGLWALGTAGLIVGSWIGWWELTAIQQLVLGGCVVAFGWSARKLVNK